jgi:hypothetical protein
MDNEQLAKTPTLERFELDLNDFERDLRLAHQAIDEAENLHDPICFIDARKKIAGVLDEIQSAREFIALRKAYLASLTPGVSTLVDDDQWATQPGEHQADRHSQDVSRLE